MVGKRNSTSNGLQMIGIPVGDLIDPGKAPNTMRIEYRGVVCSMRKHILKANEEGVPTEIKYVGVPVSSEHGRKCRYGLSVHTNGFLSGKAALNFLTVGGQKIAPKNRKPRKDEVQAPTRDQANKARTEFVTKLCSALVHACGNFAESEAEAMTKEELIQSLSRDSGYVCSEGEVGYKERTRYAILGIKAYLVSLATSHGLRFDVDLAKWVAKAVRTDYAVLVSGPWDEVSEDVALTSSLTQAHVLLIQDAGMRFERVPWGSRGRQKRGSAEKQMVLA